MTMTTTTHYGLKKPDGTDLVNVADLNYNADKLDSEIYKKAENPAKVSTGTNITLADNTEYRLANVSNLTIAFPAGSFECWMKITTAASGTITITLPAGTKYVGSAPDLTANGTTYELSIKDGVVVGAEVGDGA